MISQFPRAMDDFNRVVELKPFDERPYFLIGSIYEDRKDIENALANYKTALKIDPGFKEAEIAVKELTQELEKGRKPSTQK